MESRVKFLEAKVRSLEKKIEKILDWVHLSLPSDDDEGGGGDNSELLLGRLHEAPSSSTSSPTTLHSSRVIGNHLIQKRRFQSQGFTSNLGKKLSNNVNKPSFIRNKTRYPATTFKRIQLPQESVKSEEYQQDPLSNAQFDYEVDHGLDETQQTSEDDPMSNLKIEMVEDSSEDPLQLDLPFSDNSNSIGEPHTSNFSHFTPPKLTPIQPRIISSGNNIGRPRKTGRPQVNTRERKFVCQYCKSSYMRSHHLKEHIRRCLNIRNIVCSLCDAKFTRGSDLNVHMKKHARDLPFAHQIQEPNS